MALRISLFTPKEAKVDLDQFCFVFEAKARKRIVVKKMDKITMNPLTLYQRIYSYTLYRNIANYILFENKHIFHKIKYLFISAKPSVSNSQW